MSSHPFTICSLPPPANQAHVKSELVFYIRHQKGLTEKLYNHALNNPGASVPVLIDGPYGGINMPQFAHADRVMIIAGGSGAGWVLPFVELFKRREVLLASREEQEFSQQEPSEKVDPEASTDSAGSETPSKLKAPSLRVILATRDTSSRMWFQKAIAETLSKSSALIEPTTATDVQVYVTGKADQEADLVPSHPPPTQGKTKASGIADMETSPVQTEPLHHGRPDLPSMIHEEASVAAEAGERLSVFVCGPDTMLQDVRNAVAKENLRIVNGKSSGEVYLHTEHFSWA
jgi:NAD(P)H-flavin reductase